MRLALLLGFGLVLASWIGGCGRGDGIQRVPLKGKVTFRGQPVMEGQIRFIPQAGTKAPLTVEQVVDGRYSTATSGGVPAGRHRVEIRAYDPNLPPQAGPGAPIRDQLLPAKYNDKSELEITLEPGQGATEHDFELQ